MTKFDEKLLFDRINKEYSKNTGSTLEKIRKEIESIELKARNHNINDSASEVQSQAIKDLLDVINTMNHSINHSK